MHHPLAEHWIVAKGAAKVRWGGHACLVTEKEFTSIPLGVKHRLENIGNIHLKLCEV